MTISDFFSGFSNYPVLFVGTGISLRYFENSYSWDSLLQEIVKSYNDPRIRYFRNKENFGAINVVDNWNKCLEYCKGDYTPCP